MGVGSDDERTGNDVPLFDHDLMADAGAGGEEVDTVLAGEGFNGAVFFLVLVTLVLNVVVEGEDRLSRIENFFGANRLKLLHDRGRVVVRHHVEGVDGNKVTRAKRALGTFRKMRLRDLFNDGL